MATRPNISFDKEPELKLALPDKQKLRKWLARVISEEKKECGKLSYFFCTDEHLLKLNKKYLGHDYYTDIITFDYCEGKMISGEIFISVERVRENAVELQETFRNELLRTIVHGALHLCGYRDKSAAQKKLMRRKEDLALKLF